jgi:SAM-dependent methyltransferase
MVDQTPLPEDAEFVQATTAAYEADSAHYVEKLSRRAVADEFGGVFVEWLPVGAGDGVAPRVLDVGCGPGADVAAYAERGFDVVGVDISERLLRAACDDVPDARFARGDMRALPFGDTAFDGLWSAASFLHLARADAPDTLGEFGRVLADDGVLFLSVLAAEPHDADAVETEDGRRFTLWSKPRLESHLADAGFEVVWDGQQTDWHAVVAVRE